MNCKRCKKPVSKREYKQAWDEEICEKCCFYLADHEKVKDVDDTEDW